MKTRTKIVLLGFLAIAVSFVLRIAFQLMNTPDNMSVLGGTAIVILLFLFVPTLITKTLKGKDNAKDISA